MGTPHTYGEGEDFFFDDTVVHKVGNMGDKRRVSLFLDVRRNFNNVFLDSLNWFILWASQFNPTVAEAIKNAEDLSWRGYSSFVDIYIYMYIYFVRIYFLGRMNKSYGRGKLLKEIYYQVYGHIWCNSPK